MDEIALHNWAAYAFGRFEVRVAGYTPEERCVVTEPVVHASRFLVETADGKTYKLGEPIKIVDKMDMMYALDRFCNLNEKAPPRDITESFNEEMKGPSKE